MKMKNFYLIDSLNVNELNEIQRDFLNKYLTICHTHSSSVIDKAEAIYAIINNDRLKTRYEYNAWLFDFVNYQIKRDRTAAEKQSLKKILSSCYHHFGVKSHLEGNSIHALDNYKKAIKIRKKINDSTGLFKTFYNIALIYRNNGDLSNALVFYEKCAELCIEIEDKNFLAVVYNSLSLVLRDKGDFSKSLNYLYKALSIFEENNNERGVALIYTNIGMSLVSQLEMEEALKYFLPALKLSEKIKDKIKQAVLCVDIGSIYQQKCENDIALKYYMKAVQNLPDKIQHPVHVYLKIGTIYESQNQIDLAMDYYCKSLQFSKKIESKELLSETLSKIGALEIKRGNMNEASLQIEKAFDLAQELNYPETVKAAAIAKVQLAIKKEDYKLAYEMEKLKNEMKDKTLNENNSKEMIKHQLKYEYEKQLKQKDLEIELEKNNNRFIQEQIDIITGKNQQLASKNKVINEQLAEKDLLIQKFNNRINTERSFK